jgi:hypothetical protein
MQKFDLTYDSEFYIIFENFVIRFYAEELMKLIHVTPFSDYCAIERNVPNYI